MRILDIPDGRVAYINTYIFQKSWGCNRCKRVKRGITEASVENTHASEIWIIRMLANGFELRSELVHSRLQGDT